MIGLGARLTGMPISDRFSTPWGGKRGVTAISYLLVGLGSALGGMARYAAAGLFARLFGDAFPWGTLFVNVTGSFLIGFVATLTVVDGRVLLGDGGRQLVMIGVLGGYTTFSAFSLQTLALFHEGEWFRGGANVALSLLLCLIAVWLGYAAAQGINQLRAV